MKDKMNIGILTGEIPNLWNDQLMIIREILDHPQLELCLIIQKTQEDRFPLEDLIQPVNCSTNSLSKWGLKAQLKVEARLFKEWEAVIPAEVIKKVSVVKRVMVSPERKGILENYSEEESESIKPFNLDIIIDLGNKATYSKNILSSAKFGIWRLHFGESLMPGSGPSGFSEIVNKMPFCTVLLLQFLPDQVFVLDKAYYNKDWAFLKTLYDLRRASVSLVFKNICELLKGTPKGANPNESIQLSTSLDLKYGLQYLLYFYFKLLGQVKAKVSYKLFGIRHDCWGLFWEEGDFFETEIIRIKPQKLPKDEFWADPFLYSFENKVYVFFESLPYQNKKGKISAGRIENGKIVDVRDVLVRDYHLSYPQIFEEDGQLFLLPETGKNHRIEVYKCIEFPYRWELYSTAFEKEFIVDTTYFRDANGDRWLFLNKGGSINSELYIYKIDSLKFEHIIPHALNPVYIDCRKGRNAGAILKYQNAYYRPNQRSIDGVYGKELAINKIKTLTLTEFEEEIVRIVKPDFGKGLKAVHTLNQIPGSFILDGCYIKK